MQRSVAGSTPSFKKVLLATDFSAASQAAFPTALNICAVLQASLSILHVSETANTAPLETKEHPLEFDSVYQTNRRSLDDLCEVAQRAGLACGPIMATGIASLSILEAIVENKVDLVVLGTNAPHCFERLIFGSTAEAILRETKCPVLAVGPQVSGPAKAGEFEGPVVFATDFHRTTTNAIRYAGSFCKATQSPLHCLHVLPRALEVGPQSEIATQIMTEALHHIATESGTTVDPPVCAVTYGSEVSNAVVEYAKKHKARLIVLGIRQASINAPHLSAHIAYRVITESPCPVLTVAFASKPQSSLAAACL